MSITAGKSRKQEHAVVLVFRKQRDSTILSTNRKQSEKERRNMLSPVRLHLLSVPSPFKQLHLAGNQMFKHLCLGSILYPNHNSWSLGIDSEYDKGGTKFLVVSVETRSEEGPENQGLQEGCSIVNLPAFTVSQIPQRLSGGHHIPY